MKFKFISLVSLVDKHHLYRDEVLVAPSTETDMFELVVTACRNGSQGRTLVYWFRKHLWPLESSMHSLGNGISSAVDNMRNADDWVTRDF